MSNVLQCGFLTPSHLAVFARLDAALAARGHEVTNVLSTSHGPSNRDLGLRDVRINPAPPGELIRGARESVAEARDPGRRVAIYQAWLLAGLAQRVELVRRVIDERKPELALCDPMSLEGVIAAERSGIPWVGVSTNFAHMTPRDDADPYEQALRIFEPIASHAMHQFGVASRFRGGELVSPTHTIMPGAKEWSDTPEPDQTMCGHVLDPRAPVVDVPRRFPRWPLIVVSFGSIIHLEPELIANFARAAEGMEAEFLVSAKHFVRDYRGAIPANFVCSDFIPQVAALRHARLLVTHGGANSILEAIALAVPILAVPLFADQFRNAELVKRLGVGRAFDARGATPSRVHEALHDALAAGRGPQLALRKQELSRATSSYKLDGIAPLLAS